MATRRRGRGFSEIMPSDRGPNGFRIRASLSTDLTVNIFLIPIPIPSRSQFELVSIRNWWHCYALRTQKPTSKWDVCAGFVPVQRLPIATQSQFRNLPAFSKLFVTLFTGRPSRGIKKCGWKWKWGVESAIEWIILYMFILFDLSPLHTIGDKTLINSNKYKTDFILTW